MRDPRLRSAEPARDLVHRQAVIAQSSQQPCVFDRGALGNREVAVVNQRFDLGERPRRRGRRVAMKLSQRLDAQVAVDQHEPLGVADHDHGHLLPDLGDRSDQSATLIAVVDPQVAVPELELVQIDVHAGTVPALPKSLHLGLRDTLTMSGYSRRDLISLPSHLGLHERPHYSDDSRKDHASFDLHLGLHHIPGHSRDRGRCIRRRRRRLRVLFRGADRQPPASITIVIAILVAPSTVRLRAPRFLTRVASAGPLPLTDARVSQEPPSTLGTRALLPHNAGHHRPRPSTSADRSLPGHFCRVPPGHF